MIKQKDIIDIVTEHLISSDKFLVDIQVDKKNQINILIDGDNGINIKDCVDVSRVVESSLDRDKDDFSLNVSSPGIEYPLANVRHYRSKIGRDIKVTTKDGDVYSGNLCSVNDTEIEINILKKKKKDSENLTLTFKNIEKAHCVVRFKKK